MGELPKEMDTEQRRKMVSGLQETTGRENVGRREGREGCWGQRDNLGEKLRQRTVFHRNSGLAQLSKARNRVSTPSPDALGPKEGRPSMCGGGNHSGNTGGEISLFEIWGRDHPGSCVGES